MSSSATTAAVQQQSVRPGGFGEENGSKLNTHLPPPVVFGPDENGVKKRIEYRFNKEGNMERIVTIISPVPEFERELKSAIAVKERAGSRLSVPSTTGTLLEPLSSTGSNMEILLADRTSLCPIHAKTSAEKPVRPRRGHKKGLYPPPFIRERCDEIRDDPQKIKYDDRTVRVSNLSDDISEPVLIEQFEAFGCVTNVYIPLDGKTESGRCVGFVKYAERQEAEYAIRLLNEPAVYNKLKLQVGWAAPRSK